MSMRKEILAKTTTISSLPACVTHVLQLLQNPDSSMAEIVGAIEYDPGLTADFLRLANSAYFAGPRKIGSLREAGVLFGTQRIQQLVMASAVFPLAQHPIKGYDLPTGQLLDRLVAVGVGAEELGKMLDLSPPHYTFTAGLLHGIGKIVLGTFIAIEPDPILELAHEDNIPFDEAERIILGIDHAEVGAALLEQWELPKEIVQVVRWHNQPEKYSGDPLVVDLVHYANILSIACGLGTGIDGLHYRPCQATVERLNPKTVITEKVTCKMLEEVKTVRSEYAEYGGGK